MPRYLVTMVLYQTCEVEAENSDEAREIANFDDVEWTTAEPDGPFYVDLLDETKTGEPSHA